MCLIIDANFIAITLSPNPPPAAKPVWDALYFRKARGVYGGKLAIEYSKLRKFSRLIAQLDRAGVLRQVPSKDVESETKKVERLGHCVSNDSHIIGLARASGVRLLCSNDKALHTDFKNPLLVAPVGHVYQNEAHSHLIEQFCRGK